MPRKIAEPMQEEYYVGVSDPVELRRVLLETSKGVLQAMHRYEKYKMYREETISLIKSLSKHLSELSNLMTTLKSILPKNTVRIRKAREQLLARKDGQDLSVQKLKQRKADTTKATIVSSSKKELTDIERLEMELSEIESKLSVLNR